MDPTKVAQLVLDSYPIIPQNRLAQVEQLVFYIQKRLASLKGQKHFYVSPQDRRQTPNQIKIFMPKDSVIL